MVVVLVNKFVFSLIFIYFKMVTPAEPVKGARSNEGQLNLIA